MGIRASESRFWRGVGLSEVSKGFGFVSESGFMGVRFRFRV